MAGRGGRGKRWGRGALGNGPELLRTRNTVPEAAPTLSDPEDSLWAHLTRAQGPGCEKHTGSCSEPLTHSTEGGTWDSRSSLGPAMATSRLSKLGRAP